jgi:hypothetical protein
MKISTDIVLGPLREVHKDIARWDPELSPYLDEIDSRLSNIVKTRGMKILLLDFPAVGASFDKALSSGWLDESSQSPLYPFTPKKVMYYELISRCFDYDGSLVANGADPTLVFFIRQCLYLYKKLRVDPQAGSVSDAVDDFFNLDHTLRLSSLFWNEDSLYERDDYGFVGHAAPGAISFPLSYAKEAMDEGERDLFPEDRVHKHATLERSLGTLQSVADILISKMPEIIVEDLLPKHGPGAVSDRKTGTDKNLFPTWPRRTNLVFPADFFAYYSEEVAKGSDAISHGESSGSLLAVPKTHKGPRLITAEPTAFQFLQQGLLRWIRQELPTPLRLCIDFKSQAPSREAALLASLDGKKATVDLSSASDRLSLWTVERIFRKHRNLLTCLAACRTQMVTNATGESTRDSILLRKFAGQGNAVTFPIQSIVYAICCIASVIIDRNIACNYRNILSVSKVVRVFGDDLILPGSSVPYLAMILDFLQLKINRGKSHVEGHFRESCGMDAYRGIDVTPLYLSHLEPGNTAEQHISWTDVSNNAYAKGLWCLVKYMDNLCPNTGKRLVPVSSSPASCLTRLTFMSTLPQGSKERYNKRYHRPEVFGLVPKVHSRTSAREGSSELFAFFQKSNLSRFSHLDYLDPINGSLGLTTVSRISLNPRWVPKY